MMKLYLSKKTISVIERNKNLESHKRVCKNEDFYNILMPSEGTKILEFNQYQKMIKLHSLFIQIFNV